MAAARWLTIVGLMGVLAVAPGALAHHCTGGDPSTSGDQLSTASIPPSPPPWMIAAYAMVPIVGLLLALAIAIPSMRKSNPPEGTWAFNGTTYVWVPSRK